jgi:hypothetical protein
MKYVKLICIFVGMVCTFSSNAEVKISGYGSIIAGKTLGTVDDPINLGERRDETFTADFYDVGQYTNDITFKAESILAVQGVYTISPEISVTAQLVAKGVDDFEPEFDWYYVTYRPTANWSFMAGRRNIPMYYYSEFSEVGYAYPWMRPPANLYWWQITQFNGFHAAYNFQFADLSHTVTAFHGDERDEENKEMQYYEVLYGNDVYRVDEFWTNISGVNWVIEGDFFDIRLVYFTNDRDRTKFFNDNSIEHAAPFSQRFMGIGGAVNLASFTLLFDWNHVKYDDPRGTEFPTYLLSVVYNWDNIQPFIAYSKADHERTKVPTDDLEEHKLWSVGFRYDFHSNVAFKFQYDHFTDQGYAPSQWNYHGDARAITAGIDFIF